MRRLLPVLFLISLFSACSYTSTASSPFSMARDPGRPFGIDVSHHNSDIDWSRLTSSNVDFIFVKATQGMNYVDPAFASHFDNAKRSGIIRGAYHFYETKDDGKAQADWFIKTVNLQTGDLPPVIDIEILKGVIPDDKLHKNFNDFVARIEEHYGQKPIIYTGTNFWEHSMKEHLPGHPLWIAEYGVHTPKIPHTWQSWTFWQFTESQKIDASEKPVDGSYYNGTLEQFKKLLIKRP